MNDSNKITNCPNCGKEGESCSEETKLTCPHCDHAWTIRRVDTHQEQLDLWVKGESTHVKVDCMPPCDYECCPDFSCCYPALKAPLSERNLFASLPQPPQVSNLRDKMLMTYLRRLVEKQCPEQKVEVIG